LHGVERSSDPGFWRAWARAAFTLDLRSLALHRIALGTVLVADSVLRSRDFRLMLTADGMFPPDVVRRFLGRSGGWSLALLSDSDAWAATVLGAEAVAGVLLGLGLLTRPATLLGWLAVVSLARRAPPAGNAADAWLACQLLWAMFVPLDRRWSLDARSRGTGGGPSTEFSAGTAAVVLQLAAVYAVAGLGKCNPNWMSGEAVRHALSVHDHGTGLGMRLAEAAWVRPLSWGVPALEVLGAILVLARPTARVRAGLVVVFSAFHLAIWLTMSVGLFSPIALTAWLAMVPSAWWPPASSAASTVRTRLPAAAEAACWATMVLMGLGLLRGLGRGSATTAMESRIDFLLNATALQQRWRMFGDVPAQVQWVTGRARLADGREVDLLRGGRDPVCVPPADGFTALPHHRWQEIFWVLPQARMRDFGPGVAAGLAGRWNRSHPVLQRVVDLEIRHGREMADGTRQEVLVASWPARSSLGGGGLERFLHAATDPERGLEPALSSEPARTSAAPGP